MADITVTENLVIAESVVQSGPALVAVERLVLKEGIGVPVYVVDVLVVKETAGVLQYPDVTATEKLVLKEGQGVLQYPDVTATEKIVIAESSQQEPVYNFTTYYVPAEVGTYVIPMLAAVGGSAIYEKWEHTKLKEPEIIRAMHTATANPEESGRERLAGIRNSWAVQVNVGPDLADDLWDFILARVGPGDPFFFYDLQNNNFVWDPTGVLTTGRYLVRFAPDTLSKEQVVGSRSVARFRISYEVIEVEES